MVVSVYFAIKTMIRNCATLSIFAEHMFPFRVAAEKHCKNNICSKSLADATQEK